MLTPDNFVQLFGIAATAFVANKGLLTWRMQKIGSKRIEVAEDIIISFVKFKEDIFFLLSGVATHEEIDRHRPNLEKIYDKSSVDRVIGLYCQLKRIDDTNKNMDDFFSKRYIGFAYFGYSLDEKFQEAYDFLLKSRLNIRTQYDLRLSNQIDFRDDFYKEIRDFCSLGSKANHPERTRLEKIVRDATEELRIDLGYRKRNGFLGKWL